MEGRSGYGRRRWRRLPDDRLLSQTGKAQVVAGVQFVQRLYYRNFSKEGHRFLEDSKLMKMPKKVWMMERSKNRFTEFQSLYELPM